MAFCSECGCEIEGAAAACPNCGHAATEQASAGEGEDAPRRKQAPGRAGLLVLGVLLLIASFTPLYDGTKIVMTNVFELTEDPGVPFVYKLLGVYPLPAGLAVIILAFVVKGLVRSLAVIALGLFPLVVFYLTVGGGWIPTGGIGLLLLGGALPVAAMMLIFAGSRARRYRPSSLLGAVVGAVGGAAFVVGMVLPILPTELGVVPIVRPIMLIVGGGSGVEHVTMITYSCLVLLAMILLVAASIVCLVNAAPRPVLGLRTRKATRLWAWSVVFLFLTAFVPAAMYTYGALESGAEVLATLLHVTLPFVSIAFKPALAGLALFLLVPVGLAHLVVHLSPPEPGPLPGYAEATTGPATAQAGPAGLETRLKKLKEMLDEGLISQEDFDKKKEQILSEM